MKDSRKSRHSHQRTQNKQRRPPVEHHRHGSDQRGDGENRRTPEHQRALKPENSRKTATACDESDTMKAMQMKAMRMTKPTQ
jgi:hypothetical protein